MPDREFIHSTADVSSTLLYALDSGLEVLIDEPQPEPQVQRVTRAEATRIERGVYYLVHPNWIFGNIQTTAILGGANEGKYSVQPRVNFAAVSLYFGGERFDQGRRKLGACTVSWHRDWLEVPAQTARTTPLDVAEWYKKTLEHLSSRVVLKAGVHRYYVSRSVLADPSAGECLPPFDFIPWGVDVLKRRRKGMHLASD